MGPSLPVSQETHRDKYQEGSEGFEGAMLRVSSALADDEAHRSKLADLLVSQRFLMGGRIQAAAGAVRVITPYNCFVSGTIGDSFVSGTSSIMQRAFEAATTMRLGGGIGYDFSTLRPRGASIKSLGSTASGAVSFMHIFNAIGLATASAGHRRGAQMAVLRVDHPDILEFIDCKRDEHSLRGFNISVGVTDAFMEALSAGKPFHLRFGGQTLATVDAGELWDRIMRNTWDWAEPGVLFIDRINATNNLAYCEHIAATNPCGEQPLPPFGACLLGSFNLTKYVLRNGTGRLDLSQLVQDIPAVVRAMDNVIDRAVYPLPAQQQEALSKRRMGIGVTGMANAIEATGRPYGSLEFCELADTVLGTLANYVYSESMLLAMEKGPFPKWVDRAYDKAPFLQQLDPGVRRDILRHGIRNSHLLSIAPTGTISLCADNVSSSIEPVFSHQYQRTVSTPAGPRKYTLQDYGLATWGIKGRTADEITVQDHLRVLLTAQRWIDSGVSKTCNVGAGVDFDAFKQVYQDAYDGGAKGCTTFRPLGKRFGIMQATPATPATKPPAACTIDPDSGIRSCEG